MRERAIHQVPGTLRRSDATAAFAALSRTHDLVEGDAIAAYEDILAASLGRARVVTFWSGRASLFAILKALDLGPGDEVVIPGYTCVVVPSSVQATGARPVYADVTPAGTGPRLEALRTCLTERTRAVLVQHTYGIPADIEPILALAKSRGIAVIEDACHALGASYHSSPVGTLGDVGFFSTEYSKMLTTGQGGFAVTRDSHLADRLCDIRKGWEPPSHRATQAVLAGLVGLYLLRHPRLGPLLNSVSPFRNLVSRLTASTTPEECRGIFRRTSLHPLPNALARIGLGQARRARAFAARRRLAADTYRAALKEWGLSLPDVPEGADPLYVRFPIWVRDRERVLKAAATVGVELGVWFEGPLHPAPPDASLVGYRPGMCPTGERLAREAINLPTHPRLTEEDLARVVATIQQAVVREARPC